MKHTERVFIGILALCLLQLQLMLLARLSSPSRAAAAHGIAPFALLTRVTKRMPTLRALVCAPARLRHTDYYAWLLPPDTSAVDAYDCAFSAADPQLPGRSDKKDWSADLAIDQRISLCFVFDSLAWGGPANLWFWYNLETVFQQAPFTVYSVQLGAHSTQSAIALAQLLVRVNQVEEGQCDVVLYRGAPPLMPTHHEAHRSVPNILVLGAPEDLLSATPSDFDAVISTVPDPTALAAWAANASRGPSRWATIPTGLPVCETYGWKAGTRGKGANPLTKVLTYYGSLDNERDVDFFLAVLHSLPDGWVGAAWGLVAAPLHPQSHKLQKDARVNQSLATGMQHTGLDGAALLPDAGAHFQWLQNWEWGVPIFARNVLWAKHHPKGVFVIQDDEAPESVATRMRGVSRAIRDGHPDPTVEEGMAVFRQNFRLASIAPKWIRAILDAKTDRLKQANLVSTHLFRLFKQIPVSRAFNPAMGSVAETKRSGTYLHVGVDVQVFAAADLRPYFQFGESDACATIVLEYTTEWAQPGTGITFYVQSRETAASQPVRLKSAPLQVPMVLVRASHHIATLRDVPIQSLNGRGPAQLIASIESLQSAVIYVLRLVIHTQ